MKTYPMITGILAVALMCVALMVGTAPATAQSLSGGGFFFNGSGGLSYTENFSRTRELGAGSSAWANTESFGMAESGLSAGFGNSGNNGNGNGNGNGGGNSLNGVSGFSTSAAGSLSQAYSGTSGNNGFASASTGGFGVGIGGSFGAGAAGLGN